ncbi:MAG: hypothetical protein HZA22_06945 [Nitrospirae bacterium]|nr:hypothetical protein [Nitrospirota bacterium]MBI5695035.1 hypothetical protein [Nitrospirota bacterium]
MVRAARWLALIMAAVSLAGCAGDMSFKNGEKYALEGDWDRAVAEYRQALQDDPERVAYKTRLTKAMDQAATVHIERAAYYLLEKNPDAALYEARQAQMYSPSSDKARQLADQAVNMKEVESHIYAGQSYLAGGRPNDAVDEFYKALDIDPENARAKNAIEKITKQKVDLSAADELTLASDQPITLSFKDAKLKEVFDFLSKLAGISILFDEDVKDQPVTVFAREVSFKSALDLMLATNKLFMKKVDDKTIIIIPKTKSKQDQYQDLLIKTYYLTNVMAKDMVNIIRTMLETRRVMINEPLNSVTLRETPEKLELVQKLIEANDRKDSEVVIDVEVMLVDRNNGLNYGVDLPKGVTASYLPGGLAATASELPASHVANVKDFFSGLKKNVIKDKVWMAYPSITANWSQTRDNKETLTNPQIRVLNNKPAKILIGKRVPVQTGTVVATGGQLSTAFEYRDVGIKLTVEPNIGLTNEVTLKTTLEVSDIGASIQIGAEGNSQPTFTTTTAETILTLKDGETVIIGGLLENINKDAINGIAGLMDVPILGKIFSSNTVGPNNKREIIMTLTPHVVRSRELPPPGVQEFWSGTEESYSSKPMFEEARKREAAPEDSDAGAGDTVPVVSEEPRTPVTAPSPSPSQPSPAPAPAVPPPAVSPAPEGPQPPSPSPGPGAAAPEQPVPGRPTVPVSARERMTRVGTLSFAPEVTPVDVGQEITIDVMATEMDSVFEAPLSIIYNPKLVEFVKATEGDFMNRDRKPTSFTATANDKVGYIDVFVTRLGKVGGMSDSGKLFSLTFKGLAPGISPLVFKQNTLKDENKQPVPADLKTGTLYIR